MKKVLAMGLGALLLAGSAVTASAASQIDFSGYYRAYFANAWNRNYGTSETKINDSGVFNRMQMDANFHATDEVSVYWRFRAPAGQRWGAFDATTGAFVNYWYYGEVKQDWGTIEIGRLNQKYAYTGLSNLGWRHTGPDGSGLYTAMNPFDIDDAPFDGIRYSNRWDNDFQLVAQFNRLKAIAPAPTGGDSLSTDFYLLEGAYFWDGGGASLGFHYLYDHAEFSLEAKKEAATKAYYLNPAVSHRWDNGFGLHFEGKAGWGTDDHAKNTGTGAEKLSGYGFYLDLDYNYGPGNVNLAGWWTSGNDLDGDGKKNKAFVGMGRDFKPLLIAYGANVGWAYEGSHPTLGGGAVRKAMNDKISVTGNNVGRGGFGGGDMANHWAIDLNGNHTLTDDISVHYALAYLALTKATAPEQKKSIGWEADLSFQFKLLDNLNFGTSFGYFFAGDALKQDSDGAFDPNGTKANTYAWFSTLTFNF